MAKFTFYGCLAGATAALATLLSTPATRAQEEVDFSKGVFIVNEDWYGHNNSTVNYLLPDAEGGTTGITGSYKPTMRTNSLGRPRSMEKSGTESSMSSASRPKTRELILWEAASMWLTRRL